jgi:hypothetical protein
VRLSEVLAEVSREVASHERGEAAPPGRTAPPGREAPQSQSRQVAVLPMPREKESSEEPSRRRRHALPAGQIYGSPGAAKKAAAVSQVRSRHRRGEVTDSVVRAAA